MDIEGKFPHRKLNFSYYLKNSCTENYNLEFNDIGRFSLIDIDCVSAFIVTETPCRNINESNCCNSFQGSVLVYCICDPMGVETLKQVTAINTAFLFCYDEYVRGLFLILK